MIFFLNIYYQFPLLFSTVCLVIFNILIMFKHETSHTMIIFTNLTRWLYVSRFTSGVYALDSINFVNKIQNTFLKCFFAFLLMNNPFPVSRSSALLICVKIVCGCDRTYCKGIQKQQVFLMSVYMLHTYYERNEKSYQIIFHFYFSFLLFLIAWWFFNIFEHK